MLTSSSASGYGNGLISTPLTTLNTAVLAPIPIARVMSATVVNIGARVNRRRTGGMMGAMSPPSTTTNDGCSG